MPGRKLNATLFLTLLSPATIGTAAAGVLSTPVLDLAAMESATFQATFTYGAGGTTVKAWVQTSFDGGLTWVDVANFAFTTAAAKKISSVRHYSAVAAAYVPTDGTLADDTIKDGLLGDRLRVRYTSTGTYTGATALAVYALIKG
jgi:hypothetical protein